MHLQSIQYAGLGLEGRLSRYDFEIIVIKNCEGV
jgi:hypothetical protein